MNHAGGFISCHSVTILLAASLNAVTHGYLLSNADEFEVWLTTGDGTQKLSPQSQATPQNGDLGYNVWVDRRKRRQTIEGFGAALTNSAAYVIYHSPQRHLIMRELFGKGRNDLGISFIRMTMGASDFMAENPYTYDDISNYGTDYNLDQFSINKDRAFVIPILKEAKSINPNLKIMATPWSAPAWMKVSHTLNGGDLNNGWQYLHTYANYFLKFIQQYQAEGIHIDALTVQNEPLFSTNEYPSMSMNADLQKTFIRDHLGPLFRQNNVQTKILVFDHNWKDGWYPESIINDGNAKQYIGGVAWHGYDGRHDVPGGFHNSHPDVDMYFTEISGGDWDSNFGSVLTWNTRNIFIGQTVNWDKAVLLWNVALDDNHGPKVGVGGCANCRGVITVHNGGGFTRNPEYYALGHMSKFVRPGAVRLEANSFAWDDLQVAAFVNTDGSTVVIVQNPNDHKHATFSINIDGKHYHYQNLQPRSVATFAN